MNLLKTFYFYEHNQKKLMSDDIPCEDSIEAGSWHGTFPFPPKHPPCCHAPSDIPTCCLKTSYPWPAIQKN